MRELEEWHERRDKTRERQMAKLREKGKNKEADVMQKQLDAFLDSLGNLVD